MHKCSRLIGIYKEVSSSLGVTNKCDNSLYVIRRNCKKSLAKSLRVQDQVELKRELTRQQTREWVRKQIYGDTK